MESLQTFKEIPSINGFECGIKLELFYNKYLFRFISKEIKKIDVIMTETCHVSNYSISTVAIIIIIKS